MRAEYETGPVDPKTARTIRAIEAGNSHRTDDRIMVRYCSHPDGHAPKDCPDHSTDAMIAMREKWSGRNDR